MNVVSDPKSVTQGSAPAHEAGQPAVPAAATGALTIDLDALVANWRKLESRSVPAECAAVVKANA